MSATRDFSKLPLHRREEIKRKEDEALAAEIYEDFVKSFEADSSAGAGKAFVRGDVVTVDSTGTNASKAEGKPRLYKPTPTHFNPDTSFQAAKRAAEQKAKKIMDEANKRQRPSRVSSGPPKSRLTNLESFKQELIQLQHAREERRKIRKQLQEQLGADTEAVDRIAPSLDNPYLAGTYDNDPNTTNLFLSNLCPEITVDDLYELFGKYGPLASAKIMWPRNEDERARGYLCGFVALMTRVDADRAVLALKGRDIKGFEMKMSWAKPVPIPIQPVYVPPAMLEMTMPPPPSGLPFNAQPRPEDRQHYHGPPPRPGGPPPTEPTHREAWNKMIRNAVVKVVIPTERQVLCLIHRTIEYVVREGPMFEAMLMNREMSNPSYRFLFNNQSPAHVYYRWKLFSILEGDSPVKWRTREFRMFQDGSLWRPPPIDFFQQGMPKELYDMTETAREAAKHEIKLKREKEASPDDKTKPIPQTPAEKESRARLSDRQRDRLEDLLRSLTPDRASVGEGMLFCLEHTEAAEEIVECVEESMAIAETPLHKKIARLYLISDVLSNCGAAKVLNVSYYRKYFGDKLEHVFRELNTAYKKIEARLKAEQFKQRVMATFRAWEEQAIYPTETLIRLQNVFLGLVQVQESRSPEKPEEEDAVDGLDGIPIEEANKRPLVDYDLDGTPLEEEESRESGDEDKQPKAGFKRSKWETLDPELVEKQAMTSSKWDSLEAQEEEKDTRPSAGGLVAYDDFDEDLDGVPMDDEQQEQPQSNKTKQTTEMDTSLLSANARQKYSVSEEKRQQLRDIELKVMKFQDELELGRSNLPKDVDLQDEVAKYRQKLVQELEEHDGRSEDQSESKKHRSKERGKEKRREDESRSSRSKRRRSRSRSPKKSKKRSRSKSRSRSPSRRRRRK